MPLKRILMVGDSTTYGVGSGDGADKILNGRPRSIAVKLRDSLRSRGFSASSESIMGMGNNPSTLDSQLFDSRLNQGSWGRLDYLSIGGDMFSHGTPNQPLTLQVSQCDSFAIVFPVQNYGVIRWRLNSDPWTSYNQDNGGVRELIRIEFQAASIGNHTITVEHLSGPTVYLIGIEAWASTDDFVIIPAGGRGFRAVDQASILRPWSPQPSLSVISPDILIYQNGINDIGLTTQGTYESSVYSFLQAASMCEKKYVVIPNDISGGLSYVPSSLQSIISTETLIDTRSSTNMSDYASANSNGLMYDTLHPNSNGYVNIAELYTDFIVLDYPLPVVNVNISLPSKLEMAPKGIRILDINRNEIQTIYNPTVNQNSVEIDVSNLTQGTYRVELIENKINSTGDHVDSYLIDYIRIQ